ncbi:glycosyltransferase [Pseudarthrobacter sp. BRE9]|uniref:glycosyltransferase n=1 Tax=Pseudarthrobacter sp. BRE9 TaxID=2962582 RepID=UPI002882BB5E|nr:glycosyltransferase [Pseudarthrobacter sp. BRE9]MDT0167626.1 glycosyltransferase [Pseudarthrobacter sp. BRE9]
MTENVRVSVCMAAYNGSEFIEEQIDSILRELGPNDELLIVDDESTDDTAARIEANGDARIILHRNKQNLGYVKTFEKAITLSSGKFIFLSDQDDIWIPGRLEKMLTALAENSMVVTNCKHFGGKSGRFHNIRLRSNDSKKHLRNLLGIVVGYRLHWGCAMAFRSSLKELALPFPSHMSESHDQWLAMCGNFSKSIAYLDDDTILHRLHNENLTPDKMRGISKIVRARAMFLANLVTLATRSMRRAAPEAVNG